ncbi:MAG: hypothetical protein AAF633_11555 [Chloroflexota bacterium]
MDLNWKDFGHIAPGGAVLKVDKDQNNHFWLASPAGLFSQNGKSWHAVMRGIPFWRVNTVMAVERSVWVAGYPRGLVRSTNSGKSWAPCLIDQATTPILTMIASPEGSPKRILVAGTAGDGILRSTDGGRHWQLSNFGLRDFSVLDLAVAPVWDRREPLYAVTEGGVYYSPNAGRAWKRSNLPAAGSDSEPLAPAAVAVSPQYETNKTVYVGCEDGTLLISSDAGQTFEPYLFEIDVDSPSINALQFTSAGELMIGTIDGVYRLSTDGAKIESHAAMEPILSLSQIDTTLFAGLPNGLSVSEDDGLSWQPMTDMSARRFVWFATLTNRHWIAAGPEEGIFATTDTGQSWRPVWDHGPILAVAAQGAETLWVSVAEGVFTSADMGATWQLYYQPEAKDGISALKSGGEIMWLGSRSGDILMAQGKRIKKDRPPFQGTQPLGLYTIDSALISAVWSPARKEMQIWRKAEPESDWQLIFNRPGNPVTPHIQKYAVTGQAEILIGLKTAVFRWSPSGRYGGKISDPASPVTAMHLIPHTALTLIALTDHFVLLDQNGNVTPLVTPVDGNGVISIQQIPDSSRFLIGLVDGRVWILDYSELV